MSENRPRVLCVDDEPHVLRALTWLLGKQFDVCTATNAADGLALLQRNDYDVVISDQRMPGVTGVEFLRKVRTHAPRAIRILLTGYSDLDAMVRSANESEVFRFVTKPWNIREFPELVAEAAAIARSAPVEDDATAAPAAGASQKVLLVDDSPETSKSVIEELRGKAQVELATDLPQALSILEKETIGVIISEVRVREMDATRLMSVAKQKHPEIVGVVFSGTRDAEQVMNLINQGQVFRFIPKPLKPGFIRLVVESAMRRYHQLRDKPALTKRFTVVPAPDAAESLARDVRAMLEPASPAAAAQPRPGARTTSEKSGALAGMLRWLSAK